MDRLNQLRGDAGASRDSTLDTSSLLGEGYVTANDGSKYFSLSEVDTSRTDSPSKEPADDGTADSPASHAEIISNLSPIPKKSDLDSFKIGEQIEAANILSGGVNIFDDNENSYDGDELVIDDAGTEGDDKHAEIKLDQSEGTIEKSDPSCEGNMDETDGGSPSKDTEVVLQIDGRNVDAIDIGNGLYLYRKDGEEELAALQIQQDNHQQPDIKFLKVRENAEGNLEVYEEIEIEVPKEVPTKEGKLTKSAPHTPIKDKDKFSEPVSNKVADMKSQAAPRDTPAVEVEDLNKDNSLIESRTEVNLNGKMMKFSESRKSPLIGTFTPMTYHSTPNKEGIPLTKTMVDLQLHPNRHSENVKKTIEVHTDNCKQKLIETPTKNNKDSDEQNKSPEIGTSSSKDPKNNVIDHVADQTNQVGNKTMIQTSTENKTDVVSTMKVSEDKKNNDKKLESPVENTKTEVSDIKIPSTELEKASVTGGAIGKLNINTFNEGDGVKSLMVKSPPNDLSSTITTEVDLIKSFDEIKDAAHIENVKVNDDITLNDNTAVGKNPRNENVSNDNEIIPHKEKNTDSVFTKSQDIKDTVATNTVVSESSLKATESISYNATERNKYVDRSQNNFGLKEICKQKKLNPSESLETSSKSKAIKEINNPLETLSSSTKHSKSASNMTIKDFKSQCGVISPSDDVKIKLSSQSELPPSHKDMEMFAKVKPTQTESVAPVLNLKLADTKTDSVLSQSEQSINSKEKDWKTVSESRNQEKARKIAKSKTEDIKSNTTLKSFKNETKFLSTETQSSSSLKGDAITRVNEMEIEKKNKPDKTSKEYLRKVDGKSNQLEIMSCKVSTDAAKSAINEETNLNKDSISSNQSTNRNSLLLMKGKTTDKLDIQKKTELKQKLPTAYKNTKVPTSESKQPHAGQNMSMEAEKNKNDTKKELAKVNKVSLSKPTNNNKAAVPFGMWTEANRQEFLNKIKESKVPISTSNTKQLKQPNDLNRRDVLQKIDSQRQSSNASTKVQELNILNKIKLKNETQAFASKSNVTQKEKLKDTKILAPVSKGEESVTNTPVDNPTILGNKANNEQTLPVIPVDISSTASSTKKESVHRKEINNQDLIDKTIEGIINRAVTAKLGPEDGKQDHEPTEKPHCIATYTGVSLDEIESKMNELHGIPFVERPPHELPKVIEHENKSAVSAEVLTVYKSSKLPSTKPNNNEQKNQQKLNQPADNKVNEESDEEIIEYEPVTGDIQLNKNNVLSQAPVKDKVLSQKSTAIKINSDSKKEKIITENDFDKFARRNSITYENCLTVNFDGKEHHNVVQTVVEKEAVPKKLSRNEIMLAESKAKSHKQLAVRQINFSSKIPTMTKATQDEDSFNKSYQSKVQLAYQTVMTAKRQQECPITIIEDKPVKVVFMDGSHEYTPHQLNVQGKELSPPKKSVTEWDNFTHSNSESLDSDILDSGNDSKSQDDIKFKSKHQRKQVLTPVEAPELELIEPRDLGIEVSPKKKRKVEDTKSEKNSKSLVPKKTYLLNRNITTDETPSNSQDSTLPKESVNQQQDVFVTHKDSISAIDNLVKAAELLETQSETKHVLPPTDQNSVVQQNSPVKRGRGRPRKYPLPEPGSDSKVASPVKTPIPQKKPRLIDAKAPKHDTDSEDDEINSDGELVKENWTMGKINENIVCPICNKLFRSENVVFKHVKHCTGPSPSRSDSDKRSPRRMRQSQESDWKSEESKSDDMDADEDYEINKPAKKRKSNEKRSSLDNKSDDKIDVIVIEDTPIKDRESPVRKRERLKNEPNKSIIKPKAKTAMEHGNSNLICEFCGKTFRQLSYLVNHKLQHKNTDSKSDKDQIHKSLFSCEICKKEFRKLHHLVQHRIIHNPNSIRTLRKSSSEQNDNKTMKDAARPTEDQSAGFRCEPCDKSFRKLHHLVEHRETHVEINKKCNPVTSSTIDTTKPTLLHHCDICKKTFKKLQHLIDHKEHHLDTSSEKSDDKSVQSCLSTKDIIHECPLCYMVFPNEHSLNKHHIICQRKKKQTAAKQAKKIDANDSADVDDGIKVSEAGDENLDVLEQKADADTSCVIIEDETPVISGKQDNLLPEITKSVEQKKEIVLGNQIITAKVDVAVKSEVERKTEDNEKLNKSTNKKDGYERNVDNVPIKSKKRVSSTTPVEIIKIPDTPTPKKKHFAKDKIEATITKRQKTTKVSPPVEDEIKTQDSSDDDEVRYMLNPDFKVEESNEGKLFMKVRAKKRSSLQIERPNSKDLMKRRISLQHPPKIPRLKVKPVAARKPINANTVTKSPRSTVIPPKPPVSTDSDDSDVKYSFPEPVVKETEKKAQMKVKMQKIVEKRKSLTNIAKRKSLGNIIRVKQKINPSPAKQTRKRTAEAEHRCDCGQLFSSAALLSRHTSLAHTPPRIRRRRSPPPDADAKPASKRTEKPQDTRKTINPPSSKTGVTTRKSSVNSEAKTAVEPAKTSKTAPLAKTRRSTAAHKGVPVPEKMRKLMEKFKK